MLRGEPLAQSEVLSAVEQVFIEEIALLLLQLSLSFHCWDGIGWVMRPNSLILVSSDHRILFLSLWILWVLFCKFQAGFHVFCTEERLPSSHSAIKPRSVGGWRDGCLSGTISTQDLCSSEWPIGFLVTFLTKALLPPITQFGQATSPWKSPGCAKLLLS